MRQNRNRSLVRNAASRRLQAPDSTDLAWKQWGQALVNQYPREEWSVRIAQVPKIYQDYIRSRLIREYGYEAEW